MCWWSKADLFVLQLSVQIEITLILNPFNSVTASSTIDLIVCAFEFAVSTIEYKKSLICEKIIIPWKFRFHLVQLSNRIETD